jgi:oligopeptide transport system substrate-binding protein
VELLVVDAPRDRLAAESLRDLWEKNLGIAVKLRVMKGPAYAAVVASGEYQMALGAWAGDTFDPMTFLDLFAKGGPRNCTGWSSDAYDRLLAAARGEGDAKKRSSMLAEAERLLLADAAVVPLYTLGSYYLVNARVRGVTPNLMGRVLLQHIRL